MFRQWKASFIAFQGRQTSAYEYGKSRNMLTHCLWNFGRWNFMNAVDTGWVTDEDPAELVKETGRRFSTAIRHC
jgi:hypothetical protein